MSDWDTTLKAESDDGRPFVQRNQMRTCKRYS